MEREKNKSTRKIMSTFIYKNKTEISERPENYRAFKDVIKSLYKITEEDLNKCSITYKNKDEEGIYVILNEEDYEKAKLFSEDIIFTITEEDIEDQNKNIIRDDQNNKHYYGGIAYYSFHNQDKNDSIKMLNSPIINTSKEKNTKITYKNKGKKR